MSNPLVSFIAFNRMGSTVLSLQSLLNTTDDFDLYIGDSDSKDHTWEYLQSLKDPRIKEIRKFENLGELNVINWAISKRKTGQDFVVMENDCLLHCNTFVEQFDRAFEEVPGLGSACGWLRSLKINESRLSGYFYPDTVVGVFTCTKGIVMDKLGYYSEACCLADIEMNYRVREILGYTTGYIKTIDCSVIHPFGSYNCTDCKTKQSVCGCSDTITLLPGESRPADLGRDLFCNRFYPTLNRLFWDKCKDEAIGILREKIVGGKQVYWDSIHSGNPISEWQETNRKKFQEFFRDQYEKYLTEKGLK